MELVVLSLLAYLELAVRLLYRVGISVVSYGVNDFSAT